MTKLVKNKAEVAELLSKLHEAIEKSEDVSKSKVQHAWVDKINEYYKKLIKFEGGKEGIMDMMNDPNSYVRIWSASYSLQWDEKRSRKVLEEIINSKNGDYVSAEYTLIEFDKGNLKFGW